MPRIPDHTEATLPVWMKWLVAGLAATVFAGGTAWVSHIAAQQDTLESKHDVAVGAIADIRERVKGVEMSTLSLNAKADDSARNQDRILQKLDRLSDDLRGVTGSTSGSRNHNQ